MWQNCLQTQNYKFDNFGTHNILTYIVKKILNWWTWWCFSGTWLHINQNYIVYNFGKKKNLVAKQNKLDTTKIIKKVILVFSTNNNSITKKPNKQTANTVKKLFCVSVESCKHISNNDWKKVLIIVTKKLTCVCVFDF